MKRLLQSTVDRPLNVLTLLTLSSPCFLSFHPSLKSFSPQLAKPFGPASFKQALSLRRSYMGRPVGSSQPKEWNKHLSLGSHRAWNKDCYPDSEGNVCCHNINSGRSLGLLCPPCYNNTSRKLISSENLTESLKTTPVWITLHILKAATGKQTKFINLVRVNDSPGTIKSRHNHLLFGSACFIVPSSILTSVISQRR